MPIHDWTRVDGGVFHDFHLAWVGELSSVLNNTVLPRDHYAMLEPREGFDAAHLPLDPTDDDAHYCRKQNTVTVRREPGDRVVALIEVVSPGNKNDRERFRAFVGKATDRLRSGIHLLILDLHPSGEFGPGGLCSAIWNEVGGQPLVMTAGKPLSLASYEAGHEVTAYVEPVAAGDVVPDVPLFLVPGGHVRVPLEQTYRAAWERVPRRWRRVIAPGEPG